MRPPRHVQWLRFVVISLSSTTFWLRNAASVHRETSILRANDVRSILPVVAPHEQSSSQLGGSNQLPAMISTNKTNFLRKKPKVQPVRRTLGKIYYIQKNFDRTAYMERWLSRQTKVPFVSIPVNVTNGDNLSIYQQVASFVQLDTPVHSMEEQRNLILIIQDNFKIFDQTLGRLERALKWLPDDFDIAQLDCFLTSSLIMEEARKDFVGVYQQDSFTGGLHAMVWRPSRLDRIEAFFRKSNSMKCALESSDNLKMYCLHFDRYHRIGCFHHRTPPTFSMYSSSTCTSYDVNNESFHLELTNLPSATEKAFHSSVFNMAGVYYTYRVISTATENISIESERASNYLLLGICSANTNLARRQAIRQTWAPLAWRTYFVVAGRDFSKVEQEFYLYKDIIWVDTDEHYKFGLTPKTMAFLHFATSKVKNMEHAFKTDDDMFVNITKLHSDLSIDIDYFGLPMVGTGPVRDVESKFYMSPEEYGSDTFPTYATGGGYALSPRFLECAVSKLPSLGKMWWEDVAVGLLAEMCNIVLTAADWDPASVRSPGDYFSKHPTTIPIAHRISIENQFRIHRGLEPFFDEDSFITPRLCPDSA